MRPQPQEIKIKTYIHDVFPKLRYEGPYKKAVDVSEYYGFHLVPTLKTTRDDRECMAGTPCSADRVTVLREYLERGMDSWAQPVQLCHTCKVPYQSTLHFKLEALGSKKSVAEAVLMNWHKNAGETVKRGENLIDIETDKVTLEVAAPNDGVLVEIIKQDGEEVGSDEVIAKIDTEATVSTESLQSEAPREAVSTEKSEPVLTQQSLPVHSAPLQL